VSGVVREAEVDRATTAFHVALTQIGVSTIEDALILWESVPATGRGPAVERWLDDAIHLVMTRRGEAKDLAVAYYRLARALVTGRTTPDPRNPDPTSVTLSQLRYEFGKLVDGNAERSQEGRSEASSTNESSSSSSSDSGAQEGEDDASDRILIEELDDLERSQAEEDARLDAEAERELRTVLQNLGPKNLDNKISGIDDSQPASDVDRLRKKAHDEAGARQAAAAGRVAKNGGRSELWNTMQRDKRALAWARVSTTGTPCGFCAMLISRGAVYKTAESAMFNEGDLYHDNCNCIAVPIFSEEQYQSSRFDLNRKYQEEWPKVTKGLSGKAALSAWRRYIRQTQKSEAQAASATPNVQEA
jgi:hypothetical protein